MACLFFLLFVMIKFINNISGSSDVPYCYQPKYFLGQLVGGLLGMGSTAMSNAANARENQKNRDFQHDEAELAYQRQRTLIQEQNDYNSYSNQKKLMQDAGYNPYNLVGGTAGTAVSSSSTNAPQAGSAPSHGMQGFDPATISAIANIGLISAETKKTEAETNKLNEDTIGVFLDNIFKSEQNRLYKIYGERKEIAGLDLQHSLKVSEDASALLKNNQAKFQQFLTEERGPKELALLVNQIETEGWRSSLTMEQWMHEKELKALTVTQKNDILKTQGARLALLGSQAYMFVMSGNASSAQASYISGPLTGLTSVNAENAQFDNGHLRVMTPEQRKQYFKSVGETLAKEFAVRCQEAGLSLIDGHNPLTWFYRYWRETSGVLSGIAPAATAALLK